MTVEQSRVCSHLLQDSFGDVVESVGSLLVSRGPLTLPQMAKALDLDKTEVRTCDHTQPYTCPPIHYKYLDQEITSGIDPAPVGIVQYAKTQTNPLQS